MDTREIRRHAGTPQVIRLEGASWGCQAQRDHATGRFCYPLTLTVVRPRSAADCAGLRAGDEIVGLKPPGASGVWDVRGERRLESAGLGYYRPQLFVDGATQQLLEAGGECELRCRLAPRCGTPQCTGSIVRSRDQFDHALVCEECGQVAASSLFTNGDEFEASQRCAVSSADAFVAQQGGQAESSARQETAPAGRGAQESALARATRAGAGKENEVARREERMQKQHAKAREDVVRYCDALALPVVAHEEALQLFAAVASASNTRLKSGSIIDNYYSAILASIHLASLLVDSPRPVNAILAVADVGAGATLPSVLDWVKKIRAAHRRPIPSMQADMVVGDMCARTLQLPFSFQRQACAVLPVVQAACGSAGPVTVAAVAIVVVASRTAGACDMHMCRRASEASGLSQETLLSHAKQALSLC